MDPRIQQIQTWLQNPENQARAAAAGLNVGKFMTPQPQADQYANYLQKMIQANNGNPDFQEALYSKYLEYTNPFSRQQADAEAMANQYQIASDMASADDPTVKAAGMNMLRELYPQYMGGSTGSTGGYFDTRRNTYAEALKSLAATGNAKPEEITLNQILSTAPDQAIQSYEAPITWEERMANYNRGGGLLDNLLNLFQGNEIRQERLRQLGY